MLRTCVRLKRPHEALSGDQNRGENPRSRRRAHGRRGARPRAVRRLRPAGRRAGELPLGAVSARTCVHGAQLPAALLAVAAVSRPRRRPRSLGREPRHLRRRPDDDDHARQARGAAEVRAAAPLVRRPGPALGPGRARGARHGREWRRRPRARRGCRHAKLAASGCRIRRRRRRGRGRAEPTAGALRVLRRGDRGLARAADDAAARRDDAALGRLLVLRMPGGLRLRARPRASTCRLPTRSSPSRSAAWQAPPRSSRAGSASPRRA